MIKYSIKKIGVLILLAGILLSCGNQPQKEKRILTVTIEPLRYFTEKIAGDKFQVVSMVPKGSSPETYDPTPRQLVDLSQSEAYLKIGHIGFEQTWMDKLQANMPGMKIFDTSEGIKLIYDQKEAHGNHTHKGGIEPHVWNSTINARIIANNIFKALIELDPENESYYHHNLDSLKSVISKTDKNIRSLLEGSPQTFLIYHPALSYYARDYGLRQISIEEGGKEPSPTYLKELIEICKKEKVPIIFVQKEFDMRNAELIAQETSTQIVSINPLSYDWQKEMIRISQALNNRIMK